MTPFPCIVFPYFKRVDISAVSFQQFRFEVVGFEGHRNETLESHVAQSWWRRQWYFSTDLSEERKWLCFLPLPYCYSLLTLFPLKASVCSPFSLLPPPPPPPNADNKGKCLEWASKINVASVNATWQLYSLSNSALFFQTDVFIKAIKNACVKGYDSRKMHLQELLWEDWSKAEPKWHQEIWVGDLDGRDVAVRDTLPGL